MPFTFTKQNILHYANKYDEKFKGNEDSFVEKELKNWLPEHRYLTRDKFIKLGFWKSKRPKRHYENPKNTNEFVKNITSFAFKAGNERERVESLLSINNGIKGVSWPVASVILHFAFPEKYPILDFRVIWSLGWQQPRNYTFEFWQKYVERLRNLSKKFNLPLRVIDKAFWFYSKENQTSKIVTTKEAIELKKIRNKGKQSLPLKINGKISGLSLFYQDGIERIEIWIDKKYKNLLPAKNNQRVPIKLIFGKESYNAGLRMTSKCPVMWVCSNLEVKGKKIRLADVVKKYGFKKNNALVILISGDKLILSNYPK